jgi:hypothetical protein
MNYRKSLLAASIIASLCLPAAAFATDGTSTSSAPAPVSVTAPVQDTSGQTGTSAPANTEQAKEADAKKVTNLVGVTVTGIRPACRLRWIPSATPTRSSMRSPPRTLASFQLPTLPKPWRRYLALRSTICLAQRSA